MIRWFTKNHVASNILMAAILIVGCYTAYFQLPVEIEPAVSYPQIRIKVPLRGGTPKDVEQKIILPIEQAIGGLSGIESIESVADRNSGSFIVHVAESANIDKLNSEIESRIDRITTFPSEAEKARIYIPNTAYFYEVISVAIYGNLSDGDLILAAKKARDDLTSIKGISKVVIKGRLNKEITIEVNPQVLNAYNLTADKLARKIRETSIDLSAGSVNNNGERILIRSSSQAYQAEEFRNLIISRENGSELKLGILQLS